MRNLRKNERGTAVVEFALVMPILFLLMLGIIDFGRALVYYNQLTQLASQGARAAAVNRMPDGSAIGTCTVDATATTLQTCTKAYASASGLKSLPTYQVCVDALPASGGQPVTVSAHATFNLIPFIGNAGKFKFDQMNLHASSTERAEVVPPSYSAGCQ
jgi:Flp pilus assembly pilin Flp